MCFYCCDGYLEVCNNVVFHQRLSSIKNCRPMKVVCLPPKIISTEGCLSPKFICLPPKVAYHVWMSSTKACVQLNVVLNQWLSSIEGHLPSKDVFNPRLSSFISFSNRAAVLYENMIMYTPNYVQK